MCGRSGGRVGNEVRPVKEKELADQLIARWHTNDPFELCSLLDILVVQVPLAAEIRGFCQYALQTHIIYLNQSLEPRQARFVCAHELGHALLHPHDNRIFLDTATYQVTARLEVAANRFACHLLYPEDSAFFECPDYTVEQMAACLALPAELVQYRIEHAAAPFSAQP